MLEVINASAITNISIGVFIGLTVYGMLNSILHEILDRM